MAEPRKKRTVWYYLKEAVVFYLMLVAGMYLVQGYMLFHPSHDMYCAPSMYKWAFENVVVDVEGGQTHGWYIPLENARGVLLFSHGNAGSIADWLAAAPTFRDMGFSVLLYDYGGYGKSTGKASEARCYADARGMWNWLTETKHIPAEKILIYGQSLGGGIAADLASKVRPGAVVLESTFLSVPEVAAKKLPFLPVRWLCSYKFNTVDKIADIHAPIMIIHSPQDTLVPFAQGRKLFELANEPKTFLEIRGNHNTGFFKSRDIYIDGWEKFIGPLFPQNQRNGGG